jgi:hypothetical protein
MRRILLHLDRALDQVEYYPLTVAALFGLVLCWMSSL